MKLIRKGDDRVEFHKEIDEVKDLMDINSSLCQTMLFIFSLESFVYDIVNETNDVKNFQNLDRIDTIGPFAWVITRILTQAQMYRLDQKILGSFTVYRCCYLTNEMIEKYKALQENDDPHR